MWYQVCSTQYHTIHCVVLVTHRSDTIVEKRWPIRTIIIIVHHVFVNSGTKWICIFDHFYFKLFNFGIFNLFGFRLTSTVEVKNSMILSFKIGHLRSIAHSLKVTSFFLSSSILKSEAAFHVLSREKFETSTLSKYISTPASGPFIINLYSTALSRLNQGSTHHFVINKTHHG